MSNLIFRGASFVSIVALVTLGTHGASARPKPPEPFPTSVNCDAGGSIMDAIADGFTKITISGVCDENVVISIDGIALLSDDASPGSIMASSGTPLSMVNADGVFVEDLTIEAVAGINAISTNHAQATIQGVDLIGGSDTSLAVKGNSTVSFSNGTISFVSNGATAYSSSSLGISYTTISGGDNNGVIATGGAYVSLYQTTLDGTGSASDNVGVTANTGAIVDVTLGSVHDFTDAGVSALSATVRVDGASIHDNGHVTVSYLGAGGVTASAGSSVYVGQSAQIHDNTGYGIRLIEGSGGHCAVSNVWNNDTNISADASSGFGSTCTESAP